MLRNDGGGAAAFRNTRNKSAVPQGRATFSLEEIESKSFYHHQCSRNLFSTFKSAACLTENNKWIREIRDDRSGSIISLYCITGSRRFVLSSGRSALQHNLPPSGHRSLLDLWARGRARGRARGPPAGIANAKLGPTRRRRRLLDLELVY